MVKKAAAVLRQLTILSGRGNEIEEQSVDYAITMGMAPIPGTVRIEPINRHLHLF